MTSVVPLPVRQRATIETSSNHSGTGCLSRCQDKLSCRSANEEKCDFAKKWFPISELLRRGQPGPQTDLRFKPHALPQLRRRVENAIRDHVAHAADIVNV